MNRKLLIVKVRSLVEKLMVIFFMLIVYFVVAVFSILLGGLAEQLPGVLAFIILLPSLILGSLLFIPLSSFLVQHVEDFNKKSLSLEFEIVKHRITLMKMVFGNDTELLEKKFGEKIVELLKTYPFPQLSVSVIREVESLTQENKESLILELFETSLEDNVVSYVEWDALQKLMSQIGLDAETVERLNKRFAPYRAVFPDMKNRNVAVSGNNDQISTKVESRESKTLKIGRK